MLTYKLSILSIPIRPHFLVFRDRQSAFIPSNFLKGPQMYKLQWVGKSSKYIIPKFYFQFYKTEGPGWLDVPFFHHSKHHWMNTKTRDPLRFKRIVQSGKNSIHWKYWPEQKS